MDNNPKYSKPLEQFLEEDRAKFPNTLFALLEYCAEKYGDLPAVGNVFETPISYKEMYSRVLSISHMITEHGISKGDRIAILGENCPNWGICYFGILHAGAIAVPILPDFPEPDIRHILIDSEAKILFTTQRQLEKISDLNRTRLSYILMLDDFDKETNHEIKLETLTAIFERAIDFFKKIPQSIGFHPAEINGDDIASLIYTSGTSGHSKAVMLTHNNFLANMAATTLLMNLSPEDTFLSILPLSHSYEFTIGFLLPLVSGCRIIYLAKPPTPRLMEEACKKIRPTAVCSVPLILEKIYKKKVLPVMERNTVVKVVSKIPLLRKKIYKKICQKLLEFFGGRLRVLAIGGASFNRDAEKFFRAAGFPYLVGYGLTETAPLLAGGPFGEKTIKLSSTGKVTPGCTIKIVDADSKTGIGEILAKGPNVMKGYFKEADLTKEAFDEEGWFRTGDLGYFDKFNNLHIKGRTKNMILMSNGENIYPEAIEEKVNSCFYVLESLVIENNNQLEAWVYPDYDLIDDETKGKTQRQRQQFVEQMLEQVKEDVNLQLSSFSKLSRVIEQNEPFVKTATHKIKRYLYTHPK